MHLLRIPFPLMAPGILLIAAAGSFAVRNLTVDIWVMYIAASPPGKKMGHAAAIVSSGCGTYAPKRTALEAAGATVLDSPSGVG